MKKIVIALSLLFSTFSNAQDYYHGVGGAWNTALFKTEFGTEGASVPLIFYKATLGFDVSRSSNFGISAYPGLGFFISTQQGSYGGFQIPIVGEYYFGDIDDKCFYMGAGFDVNGVVSDGSGGLVLGPHVGIGGQFEVRDNLIGIRGGYTYGVNGGKNEVTGFKETRMSFNFGLYYILGQ